MVEEQPIRLATPTPESTDSATMLATSNERIVLPGDIVVEVFGERVELEARPKKGKETTTMPLSSAKLTHSSNLDAGTKGEEDPIVA